ncbi:ubiquitin carboxyl-terminal hydrolase isozyme L5-like [Sycon ciliatum]|uniref:ubiquitin carboxyl-terminal hydrolase isozyme L5-like n=1 Tax=Sycon ciliatum TaxID=27933 RepID=UPI0020A93D22|eukprot:scpid89215/ scgid35010/ Ubiquitin carboxyl-terminal hydrolase isozyme L5; Ubiquitin C-terminal hydrolase UCH37; Ubiquitin thioesterase L5
MAAEGDWCLIESDPSVFTELIRGFGVKGLQVEELYSLDDELLAALRTVGPANTVLDSFPRLPVHGLIFLFRWHKEEKTAGTVVTDDRAQNMFFAKQVITNACATQALLSVLLNTAHKDVDLGQSLTEFKANTATFDPAMKGLSLSNMEFIRSVHNSFSRQTLVEFDPAMKQKDEEPFHFVAYLPIDGRIYELDGLKDGPIDLGKVVNDDWLQDLRPVIQTRMQAFMGSEIRFNLMAITSSRTQYISARMEELGAVEGSLADGPEKDQLFEELQECSLSLEEEDRKMARHKAECARHKHNYVPLIMQMLKLLAQKGELVPMVEESKERRKRKAEEQKSA